MRRSTSSDSDNNNNNNPTATPFKRSASSSNPTSPTSPSSATTSPPSKIMLRRVGSPPKKPIESSPPPPSMPMLRKVVVPPRKIPSPPPPSIPILRKVVLPPKKVVPPPEPSTPMLRHVSPIEKRTDDSSTGSMSSLPMLRPVQLDPKAEYGSSAVAIANLVTLKPLTIDNPVVEGTGIRSFSASGSYDAAEQEQEQPVSESQPMMQYEENETAEIEQEMSGLSESVDSIESEPQSMTESMNSLTNLGGQQEGEESISSEESEQQHQEGEGERETQSTFDATTVEGDLTVNVEQEQQEVSEIDENAMTHQIPPQSPSNNNNNKRLSHSPRKSSIVLAPTPQGPDANEIYSNAKQGLRSSGNGDPLISRSLSSTSSDCNMPSTPQLRHVVVVNIPKEEIHDFEGTAKHFFKLNADRGDLNAQYYIAKCYLQGKSIAVNKDAAIRYFQLAAEQGHAGAKSALAKIHV